MTDICATIDRLLSSPDALLSWQRAYLKSAARCDQLSETQIRVIRDIEGVKT